LKYYLLDYTKKVSVNTLPKYDNMKKLDEQVEKGELKHKKINIDLKIEFQKWRQSQGLTQKQVAQKLNVTPSIINNFETGKLNHDPKLVSKIKRMIKA
jgi:putative transcription factor